MRKIIGRKVWINSVPGLGHTIAPLTIGKIVGKFNKHIHTYRVKQLTGNLLYHGYVWYLSLEDFIFIDGKTK